MKNFDYIIRELEYRTGESPNFKNPRHISILSEIIDETDYRHIKNELLNSLLTEKEVTPRTSKEVERDGKEDEKYKGVGGPYYVKSKDWIDSKEGEKSYKPGAQKFVKDGDSYKPISQDEFDKDKSNEPRNDNPEIGDKEADAAEEEQLNQDNIRKTFSDEDYQKQIKAEQDASNNEDTPIGINSDIEKTIEESKTLARKIYGDDLKGSLLQNSKTSDQALRSGYRKGALYVAPGNAGSNFNENMSIEGSLILNEHESLDADGLTNVLYERTRNTVLGSQQKQTIVVGGLPANVPDVIPVSERDLYKSCILAARSAMEKNKRAKEGKESTQKEFNFGKETNQLGFGGSVNDLKKLSRIIKGSNNAYMYDVSTKRSYQIPKEKLLEWVKGSGGGENASDSVILTIDNNGNVIYDGWSDKKTLGDIQGNSTLNDDFKKMKNRVDDLSKSGNIDESDLNSAKDIISKNQKEIVEIEKGYKLAVYKEAAFLNKSDTITRKRLEKFLRKQERIYKNKKMTNHIENYRKKTGLETYDDVLASLLENGENENLIATERSIVNLIATMERMEYEKKKQPIPSNLNSDQIISDARDNALMKQREIITSLNNLRGKTKSGKSIPLGDLLSFQETVDFLHIDKIDDLSDKADYEQLLKRNTQLIMGGVNIPPGRVKECLGVDDLSDYEDNFETVLSERTTKDRETGLYTTGKVVLSYAVNKHGERKFIGEKRYRSKSGKTGKTDTTIQWSPEMQSCFNTKSK